MRYDYPTVTGGYRWNCLQRCLNTFGIEPTMMADIGDRTVLEFSRDLTQTEKAQLDTIMANNPTLPPPPTGSRFVIRDVWNQKTLIQTNMGFTYNVYYSESVPGSGNIDQIELHLAQTLTSTQRAKILSEYAKLISFS